MLPLGCGDAWEKGGGGGGVERGGMPTRSAQWVITHKHKRTTALKAMNIKVATWLLAGREQAAQVKADWTASISRDLSRGDRGL